MASTVALTKRRSTSRKAKTAVAASAKTAAVPPVSTTPSGSTLDAGDIYQRSKRCIKIANDLRRMNVIYGKWDGKPIERGCDPFHYDTKRLKSLTGIKTASTAGFINIIRRRLSLQIPTLMVEDRNYSGGLSSYIEHYRPFMKKGTGAALKTGDLIIWKRTPSGGGYIGIYAKVDLSKDEEAAPVVTPPVRRRRKATSVESEVIAVDEVTAAPVVTPSVVETSSKTERIPYLLHCSGLVNIAFTPMSQITDVYGDNYFVVSRDIFLRD